MTREELEKIGIIWIGSNIYPHRYFVPQIGEVDLGADPTIYFIFELIYGKGYESGIKKGESNKVNQMKKVLNIETED